MSCKHKVMCNQKLNCKTLKTANLYIERLKPAIIFNVFFMEDSKKFIDNRKLLIKVS